MIVMAIMMMLTMMVVMVMMAMVVMIIMLKVMMSLVMIIKMKILVAIAAMMAMLMNHGVNKVPQSKTAFRTNVNRKGNVLHQHSMTSLLLQWGSFVKCKKSKQRRTNR